jgi:diaminohydroxyphosphoribosylaminopyrimidine deaminase/5-amino-6-(5-phosphoribosylamino)uracil reductase
MINIAITFDGKISIPGKRTDISDEVDWNKVHNIRNNAAAIIVGSETIMIDNPSLLTKSKYIGDEINHPVRVILDRRGRCSSTSRVFQFQDQSSTVWINNSNNRIDGITNLQAQSISEMKIVINEELDRMDIEPSKLVLIEGGAKVITSAINERIVDTIRIFRSPKILPNGSALFDNTIKNELKLIKVTKLGIGIEEFYEII